jgi:hypothetical protein
MPEKGILVIGLSFSLQDEDFISNKSHAFEHFVDSTFFSCITIITGNPLNARHKSAAAHEGFCAQRKYRDEKMLMAINHAHVLTNTPKADVM